MAKRPQRLSQSRRNVLRREKRAARKPVSVEEHRRRTAFVEGANVPGQTEVMVKASRMGLHSQLQDPVELAGLQTVEQMETYLQKLRMKTCLLRLIPLAAGAIGGLDPEAMRDASDWIEAAGEAARG